MHFVKPDVNIDFLGKRYIAFAISAILIMAGFVVLIMRGGPNYGVDFSGGLMIQIKLTSPQTVLTIREALRPVNLHEGIIQALGEEKEAEYVIRIGESPDIDTETLNEDLQQVLNDNFGEGSTIELLEMVGPKVGKDLRQKALFAIFYSILFIAVYISGRFEHKWTMSIVLAICLIIAVLIGISIGISITWLILVALAVSVLFCWMLQLKYALGAILSLVHDVAITLGAFALTNKEISLTIIAAFLTLVGYSLNDTIIIYDRIRENMRLSPGKKSLIEIMNRSVNQTLSRTILTSGTTLLTVSALFFFGGVVIHDFAFALMIGVLTGTYSSVYVASPLLLLYEDESNKKHKRKR